MLYIYIYSSEGTLCIYKVALLNVFYIYMCVCVYIYV